MAGAAEDIVAWTVSAGLEGLDQAELMAGYCERLVAAGVPLWRASIGADTLHPLIVAQGHRWLAGEGVARGVLCPGEHSGSGPASGARARGTG